MALIPCPECQKDVSTRAPACPHCGCPLTEPVSPPPEEANRLKPSANSLDGTTWKAVGDGPDVLWYFDEGGRFWVDNPGAGSMMRGDWTQQGNSVTLAIEGAQGTSIGQWFIDAMVTRTGESIVGQTRFPTDPTWTTRIELRRAY